MVLDRFNALVFVGDDMARRIYGAFNVLLREDLELGVIRMSAKGQPQLEPQHGCRCEMIFGVNKLGHGSVSSCLALEVIRSNHLWPGGDGEGKYYCNSESFTECLPCGLGSS